MNRFACLCVIAACSSSSSAPPPPADAARPRRKIEPPPGQVRAMPPHAIDRDGIGPYRVRVEPGRRAVTQADIFAVLPSIPRVAILDIAGVLDVNVTRAEDDALLVGGPPGEPISFIAALTPGIARTEGGLAVGARRAELAELGPPLNEPRSARDPRIVIPKALPNVEFLVEDRVIAILLRDPGAEPPTATAHEGCVAELPAAPTEIVTAAGADPLRVAIHPACFTSSGKEAIVVAGDTVTVVEGDGSRARKVGVIEQRGLVWAAPLRNDLDRDDIVAISERRDDDAMTVTLTVYRVDGGRIGRVFEEPVYTMKPTSAQWIGARLGDVRLMLTVESAPESFLVGGVLVHAPMTGVRDVAPLLPVTVARRRRTATPAAPQPSPDAGAPVDAGSDAAPPAPPTAP